MLVFHELVYEGYVLADSAPEVYTGPDLMPLMGAVDVLHVSGYATQVTGTSPTLQIAIDVSNDRLFWYPQDLLGPVIDNLPLSTSTETFFQAVETTVTRVRFGYVKLKISLDGTTARGFLRVWATGRDLSRRAAKLRSSKAAGGMLSAPGRSLTLPGAMRLPNGMPRPKL